jgi:hypothetical protein
LGGRHGPGERGELFGRVVGRFALDVVKRTATVHGGATGVVAATHKARSEINSLLGLPRLGRASVAEADDIADEQRRYDESRNGIGAAALGSGPAIAR